MDKGLENRIFLFSDVDSWLTLLVVPRERKYDLAK